MKEITEKFTISRNIKIELGLMITVILLVCSVIAAHFSGIAASKAYTDKVMADHEREQSLKLEKIYDQVVNNGQSIVRLETKVEHRP